MRPRSRFLLPFLLASGLLLGGYALLRPVQAQSAAPVVLWVETQGETNRLLAAPADDLQAVRYLRALPPGVLVDAALSPARDALALVAAAGNAETLWLVSLSGGEMQALERAAGIGALRWQGEGLAYQAYLPAARPQEAEAIQAVERWYSPAEHPPAPQAALFARGQALVWADSTGRERVVARAGRGLSALWQPARGEILLTRLEGGAARLLAFDPSKGYTQSLATLPPAEWRILDRMGAWAAAERYPRGVQILSLQTGTLRALGRARRFVGFLPPSGAARPLQGSRPPKAASACAPVPQGCPVERAYGYQPPRLQMGATFVQAAQNGLGSAAPVYEGVFTGRPPVRQPVSPQRPLPHIILRGIAWQESVWLQYLSDSPPYDGVNACTIVSFDCGYGLMQVTSCMAGGCGWLDPPRAAAELPYNLGAGVNILIQKWNSVPYLGANDPTNPAEWYYAVLAYNGWSTLNDPNNTSRFDPRRPPFRESAAAYRYPYQEKVYGWMAHPPHIGGQALWRETGIPPAPRGIFGLRAADSWTPPAETTRPLTHLFHDLRLRPGSALTLSVQNTRPYTLALDILFYNADGTFNRRYLPPAAQPPWFVQPYLRVAPSGTFTLPLHSVFFTETFTGYLRVYASAGLSITLERPAAQTSRAFLPLVLRDGIPQAGAPLTCTQVLRNGGFEAFADGRPAAWSGASAGGYVLADSTWFWQGHSGGYLGGYPAAADTLSQTVTLPAGALTATLSFVWDVRGAATLTDRITVTLVDAAGGPLVPPWTASGAEASAGWERVRLEWPLTGAAPAPSALVFTARTGAEGSTAFFVDEARLEVCAGGK